MEVVLALAALLAIGFVFYTIKAHSPSMFTARVSGAVFDLGIAPLKLTSEDYQSMLDMSLAEYRTKGRDAKFREVAIAFFLKIMFGAKDVPMKALMDIEGGFLTRAIEIVCGWADSGAISRQVAEHAVGQIKMSLYENLQGMKPGDLGMDTSQKLHLEATILGLGATRGQGLPQYWGKSQPPVPKIPASIPGRGKSIRERAEARVKVLEMGFAFQFDVLVRAQEDFLTGQGVLSPGRPLGRSPHWYACLTLIASMVGAIHDSRSMIPPKTLQRFFDWVIERMAASEYAGDRVLHSLREHVTAATSDVKEMDAVFKEAQPIESLSKWIGKQYRIEGKDDSRKLVMGVIQMQAAECRDNLIKAMTKEFAKPRDPDVAIQDPRGRESRGHSSAVSVPKPPRVTSTTAIEADRSKPPFLLVPQFEDARPFMQGLAAVRVGEGFGFIDKAGTLVIRPQFEDVEGGFSEGLAAVCLEGKWGFIDLEGRIVIEPQYDEAHPFSQGLGGVGDFDSLTFGFIDQDGDVAFTGPFHCLSSFSESLARVRDSKSPLYGYVDLRGRFVIPPSFEDGGHAGRFHQGLAAAKKESKCGLIDKEGHWVVKPQFEGWMGDFAEGVSAVLVEKKLAYIDRAGTTVLQTGFYSGGCFSEGLAAVAVFDHAAEERWKRHSERAFREKGILYQSPNPIDWMKWGYIDRSGKLAFPIQFERAEPFSEGLAAVRIDHKWGYIQAT